MAATRTDQTINETLSVAIDAGELPHADLYEP